MLDDTNIKQYAPGSKDYYNYQKSIIFEKTLVKLTYDLWYSLILKDYQIAKKHNINSKSLELGSGGSYLKNVIPDLITSDVVPEIADIVIDARKLPFPDNSLNTICMTHSFHHIPDIEMFLSEANRTLIKNGRISIIDVCNTPFSKFFFTNFHPEPFNTKQIEWPFPSNSNIDANQALTWIIFNRDIKKFEKLFPNLKIVKKQFLPWLGYLLSGGVTKKNLVPKSFSWFVVFLEKLLTPLRPLLALHWHITIEKV